VSRIGWLDLSSGASGDMLLGALVGAGVPVHVLASALAPLDLAIAFAVEPVQRAGLAATRVHVQLPAEPDVHRTWADVRELIAAVPSDGVRGAAGRVFAALATAEAGVHGIDPEQVIFHEVGALDAIADVVGVCAAVDHLGLDRLIASPIALGGGSASAAHGRLPVPVPAVLELLRAAGAPTVGAGAAAVELCTPTGAALVTVLADDYGPFPAMTVREIGAGAGARDLPDRPNVVRLVLGDGAAAGAEPPTEPAVLVETNVDDLDPRLWPGVLAALLDAGAADAWLTPILMKKGRPAHALSVLVDPAGLHRIRDLVYRHTSTLGLRESTLHKRPLDRRVAFVDVDGRQIAVKCGFLSDGRLVTAQPEWADVEAAASALGIAAREVLARASAAARELR
jgi:uncharacterized protein (TIGR00299 family) protein